MSNGRIRGITIELNGDTTGLNDALKTVDKQTNAVQSELKQVERLLKFDPTNVELLAQKQQLLGDAVNSTSTRLDALKQAQAEVERQFASGEIGAEQYRAFQREIVATEGRLQAFQRQLASTDAKLEVDADTSVFERVKDELGDIADKAKETGAKIGKGISDGAKVAAKGVAAIGAAAVGAAVGAGAFVESQKEMNMDLARLRTNAETAGFSLDSIETGFQKISAVSGEADSAVEAMSNLMATDFSEAQLAEAIEYVNGAAIKFSDTLKTEGIADGLQETFATGKAIGPFAELLERSGVDLEKFDAGLAKAAKSGTETDYVLQQLSQLGLGSTYQAYQDNNAALLEYNQAQADSELKLAALATAMTPFVTAMLELGNIILDVILGNKSLSEGFGELVEIIQGLAGKFLTAAKDAMPGFIEGIQSALPQVLEAGIEILTKIIEGIGNKYPDLMNKANELIGKLVGTLIENLPKLLDTGVKFLTSIITGIANSLPKLVATALNLVLKLASTIVQNLPKIIEAGVKILTSIVTGIAKAMPKIVNYLLNTFIPGIVKIIVDTDWAQTGSDIINGLIKGISSMKDAAIEAITGVVGSLVEKAKSLLKIKSPSRVFKQIGLWTGEGLAIGIDGSSAKVNQAMQNIGDGILAVSDSYQKEYSNLIDEFNKKNEDKNDKTLERIYKIQNNAAKKKRKLTKYELQEIALLEGEYKDSKLKSEVDFNKKYQALVQKSEKEYLEVIKSHIADKKSLEELSLVDEAAIWEQSIELFAEGSRERIEAQKAYQKATEAINKEIVSINTEYQSKIKTIDDKLVKDIEDATKKYTDAVDKRSQALSSFAGTFDTFNVELNRTGLELTNNLQSQVDGFKQWQTEFEKLSGRGVNGELLKELSELGVKALPELAALNSLTDEQLTQYSALYQEKAQLARSQAETELVGMKTDTELNIIEMKKAANTELSKLQTEWTTKIKGVTEGTKTELSTLKQIGVDAGQGLLDGLTSMQGPLIDKATEIANAISSAIQSALDIHSPSRVMKGFGINVGQGLIIGMDNMINKVAQSSARLSDAIQSAQGSLSSSVKRSKESTNMASNTPSSTTTHTTEQHFHMSFTSPKALDPYESARLARNALKEAGLHM